MKKRIQAYQIRTEDLSGFSGNLGSLVESLESDEVLFAMDNKRNVKMFPVEERSYELYARISRLEKTFLSDINNLTKELENNEHRLIYSLGVGLVSNGGTLEQYHEVKNMDEEVRKEIEQRMKDSVGVEEARFSPVPYWP